MNQYSPKPLVKQSQDQAFTSATSYFAIDSGDSYLVSDEEYRGAFKAIHLLEDGDVEILGHDGHSELIPLTAGLWPYGGKELESTTSNIILIF